MQDDSGDRGNRELFLSQFIKFRNTVYYHTFKTLGIRSNHSYSILSAYNSCFLFFAIIHNQYILVNRPSTPQLVLLSSWHACPTSFHPAQSALILLIIMACIVFSGILIVLSHVCTPSVLITRKKKNVCNDLVSNLVNVTAIFLKTSISLKILKSWFKLKLNYHKSVFFSQSIYFHEKFD